MTWKLVSDSSSDLVPGQLRSAAADVETVPLCLRVGEREFWDTEELNTAELLLAMAEEKSASSSACPSPAAFARVFEKADRTICVTISSNLSGSYNAAVLGCDLVLEEHPEKKICVIDSKSTSGAEILILRKARSLIEANPDIDFEELCDTLRIYQASLRTVFTLQNFDNLIKNGRMRPLVGTCSFGMSCNHNKEPGCKIQEAVYSGVISEERFDSWQRICDEITSGSWEY